MPISVKELLDATAPPAEPHPADVGYAPPVSSVKLPSRGMIYPPESPLYKCDSVDIKAVTAKEEDILSSQTLIKKGVVLSTLMRACITNRLVDPEAMLVGDRNAILVAIRVSAYGPAYLCKVVCPACAEECEHSFDLSRLALKELESDPVGGPGSNEFAFTLPATQKEVRFKLMDASMVAKLDRDIETIRKKLGQELGVTLRLMTQVTSIAGVDKKDLKKFIDNLPARDSRALRRHMTDIAPDVDMTQEFECPSCGNSTEVEIPIGTEFFWPSRDQ